ncbi:hypothetical protein [Mycobacterium syngnathidarum]
MTVASGFEFDESELRKAVASELKTVVKQMQKVIDGLGAKYEGRPVEEIKPVLKRELARFDASADTDAELTEYAQAISDGEAVNLQVARK